MRNAGLIGGLTGRGYVVLAPSALPGRPSGPASWNARLDPGGRDDVGYLEAVVADAAGRFGFPRARVIAAGFSGGGMMVWRLACDAPERFAAFTPVSGLMWRPLPDVCQAPVRLFHTHGWSDTVVPLEGRSVAGGAITQGDLFDGFDLLRAASGCASDAPDAYARRGEMLLRRWSDCAPGGDIVFALHPGGHGVPPDWAGMMLDWFEAPGAALASEPTEG